MAKKLIIDKSLIKKILVIKLRGIGDVVLSTIVLENLRKDFPNARIDYLAEKPSQPGLFGLPYVNDVLIFERHNFWAKVELILQIRKNKYELVLDFFANPSTAIVTFFSGAKFRVGFPYRGRKYAYNIFGPEERGKYHAAQLHLEMLKDIGLSHFSKKLFYNINSSALRFADEYFKDNFFENDFVVGICPTGGWASKKCDPEKFAEIANAINSRFNAKVLILWGKSDENDAKIILNLLGSKAVYAPQTTIQEMAALISKCKLLVANDSGPMHISTAVGTPVLSMHGPTSPFMQGPFGDQHDWIRLGELECIECNLLDCPRNHECFKNLPIEHVLQKVDLLISKNNLKVLS
jgi:lipopolysaccharide heptosyltransferase II